MSIIVKAPAKLNLALDVIGRRADGYHDLRTVMQTIDWCDTVTVDKADSGIHLSCDGGIPEDETNIAYRAAALFADAVGCKHGFSVKVEKSIPAQAGMAGGSTDGAAVLRGLNELMNYPLTREQLLSLGAKLGADVPFCILGGTALATGIGTELTPLPPMPSCYFVVSKPQGGVSTPEAYRLLDNAPTLVHPQVDVLCEAIRNADLDGMLPHMANSFEAPLALPHTDAITAVLKAHGASAALLTGSGSAVFGLFKEKATAETAAAVLGVTYRTRVCQPVKPKKAFSL